MLAEHWSVKEVQALWAYLDEGERAEFTCAVEFAKRARANPDSLWGPIGSWGELGPEPVKVPEVSECETSSQVIDFMESRMRELLRVAVLRRSVGN